MGRIQSEIDASWTEVACDMRSALETLSRYTRTKERLREIWLEERDELSRADLGRALRRYANASKLTGKFDEALEAQDETVAIWRGLERDRALGLAEIEGADIAHLALSADAWPRFEALEEKLAEPEFELYQDFYWEYRALAHCRDEEYALGLEALQLALDLRIEQERKERQLEETRALIARIEEALCSTQH